MDKPKIRAVEAIPVERDGEKLVCLRDPSGLAPQQIVIGLGAYYIITMFDGRNDLRDIQAAFMNRYGELPLDKLEELVKALDAAYFLDSPAFAERERRVREEFLAAAERPAALAGLCYASDANKLRLELAAYFDPPEGPGRSPARMAGKRLSGLIAPHIDPPRGGAAYAHAYGELLAHEPPELVIILGTSHYGAGPELFTATRKNYTTPLGAVETDREFVDRLAAGYQSGDLFADEMLHRSEHSIEFQAVFLAWALGIRGYQVVPILVSSFHNMVSGAKNPADEPRVRDFVDVLGGLLAAEKRSVLILAGVDFAHVGRKFGDQFAVDEKVAARIQHEDLALIETIKRGDAAEFFADVARDRDARKICGLAPMYTQLALLSGHPARLLKYGIAMEPQTESCVSFASLAID